MFIIRQPNTDTNPTLAGGVYCKFITLGRPAYFNFDGTQTRFILFIADGGRYGLDKIDFIEYKSVALSEIIFHRGTITKQVSPKTVSSVDVSGNTLTSNAHGYNNGDTVRLRPIDGVLPLPFAKNIKYYVVEKTTNTFKLSLTEGGGAVDITEIGTGSLIVWKADAGFDDPNQGLPTYCPEVNTTFSNIAYIEGKLPAGYSSANEPDWQDFRIQGTGRRLMDYDSTGAELGVISNNDVSLANIALQIADNLIVNYQVDPNRIDWASWNALKVASDVQILQRPIKSDTALGAGKWTGRYYSDNNFQNLFATRLDPLIDLNFGTSSPIAGMPTTNYSVRHNGQIKPSFSEVYEFYLNHNDGGKVYLDGQLIISNPISAENRVQVALEGNKVYDVQVELKQGTGIGQTHFYWESASQASQPVPAVTQGVSDTSIVERYGNHTAFVNPTEASEVHERIMERAVGWDWTDDETIKFLAPDRPIKFAFSFDQIDDDSLANFVRNSFKKSRRKIGTRKNFQLFKYRNVQKFGFPVEYTQADRPNIRKLQRSQPNNDPAQDLGVSTRSLAERLAEMEMVLKADPKDSFSIDGLYPSSKLRKNELFTISYYAEDGNFVADERCVTTLHSWGDKAGRNKFEGLPLAEKFYTDEELVITPEEAPTDLEASFDTGSSQGLLEWVNNNALGSNIVERKLGSGSWEQVAVLAFNVNTWTDTTITLNGVYLYRVSNSSLPTEYTDEEGFTVTTESDPSVNIPTALTLSDTDGVVTCDWTNNGGTGENVIQRKQAGGSWGEVGRVASGVATFDDESISFDGDYIYRVYNVDEVGYTDEETITVDVPDSGGEVGEYPVDFSVLKSGFSPPVAYWANRGGSGNNIIEVLQFGTYVFLTSASPSDDSAYLNDISTEGFYEFRISNESCSGYSYTTFYYNNYEV